MVDSEIERRQNGAEKYASHEEEIQGEISTKETFESKIPGLADGYREDEEHYDDQGKFGSSLGLKVMGSKSLYGDEVECVVIESPDPGAAKPKDGPLNIGCEISLLRLDTISINNKGYEGPWEKSSDDNRSERGVIGVVWWIGDEPDMEEEHSEYGGKEDLRRSCTKRQDGGESAGHGK